MNAASFTAASAIPYKMFRNPRLMYALSKGEIPPVHLQFSPTNRCNLRCSFCSCVNRNKSDEMGFREIVEMIDYFANNGMQSVTITGGGEPMLHPDFDAIVRSFHLRGVEVGLVTNGTLFDTSEELDSLKWCRVSTSDERALVAVPDIDIDWAYSYVLSDTPDIMNLVQHIGYANEREFTHVRVVGDLLHPDAVPIEDVRDEVREYVDDSLVIWQGRKDFTHGAETCLISLLKPMVAADGMLYPCCGVQYAREEQDLGFSPEMTMGYWRDFDTRYWDAAEPFDGSQCVRCYYDAYNTALAAMLEPIEHGEFV